MTAKYAAVVLRRRLVIRAAVVSSLLLVSAAAGALAGLLLVYSIDLPPIADLEHYPPTATAELFDNQGHSFATIALEQRVPVSYSDISPLLRESVISVEERDFHVSWLARLFHTGGAIYRVLTLKRPPAATTLSMQLARMLFQANDGGKRTFSRRLQECFVALEIEASFTRDEIFTLYANRVYMGHGIYGLEAAANYYFSKHARDLTAPEAALLAGFPGTAAWSSPASSPEAILRRRNAVISSMLEDGVLTAPDATRARAAPLGLRIEPPAPTAAPWFVEEVRRQLETTRQFETTLRRQRQQGQAKLRVYTTVDIELQQAADRAVLDGLAAYERRHGWRGHLLNVNAGGLDIEEFQHPDWSGDLKRGDYVHALVTGVLPYQVTARIGRDQVVLTPEDWAWTGFSTAEQFVKLGDILYVHLAPAQSTNAVLHGALEQDSGAEGSLLAIDNASGDVLAMVGGRDFNMSQVGGAGFNRATQAERQTGSSFKPYVFTAAVEAGARPEQSIEDTPVSFGGFTPRNLDGKYLGRISLLQAFADSRNVPAMRLAERVGMRKVVEVAHRFGITEEIPATLPVALGSAELTLENQVVAYGVFPNDGVRVQPRLVRRVTGADGSLLWHDEPEVAQATSAATARKMMGFFKEETRSGTAAAASALNHQVAGKAGTTTDYTNAWFIGFSPSITCGVWVGFDSRQPLGEGETGARAALPVWMDFMKVAIAGRAGETFPGNPKPAVGSNRNQRLAVLRLSTKQP